MSSLRHTPLRATILLTLGLLVMGCAARPQAPRPRPPVAAVACTAPHQLAIRGLSMVPDPLRSGDAIAAWRVALQSDRNGECYTVLEVYDQDQVAGRSVRDVIRPGHSVYEVPAARGYRFQRHDPCFVVQANIGGAPTPVEAQRTFCARQLPGGGWSLQGR